MDHPTTIVCDTVTPNGRCGATTTVVSAHPRFDSVMFGDAPGGQFEQVLRETRYVLHCPKCGWRDQVVKADGHPGAVPQEWCPNSDALAAAINS